MIIASSSFCPPAATFMSPLKRLLFLTSYKWRACSQAKDDDDDDDDSGGSDDDGDDDDNDVNDDDDHHHDDQR